MATLDPNAWYQVSETRVDNTTAPLRSNLQSTGEGLKVFPRAAQAWQFQPVDGVRGRYLMRLNTTGVTRQLSACFREDEVHPGRTGICLIRPSTDAGQKWDISEWGDGTFKFVNVANGTDYVLDVHPGNPPFMSDSIEGDVSAGAVQQPAQHWIMTSERPVNDGAYSTIYSDSPQTAPTSTGALGPGATGGSSRPSEMGSPDSGGSGGLSAGAAAGIAVAVTAVLFAILVGLGFFWWRRRRERRAAAMAAGLAPQYEEQKPGVGWDPNWQKSPVEAPGPAPYYEVPVQAREQELDSTQIGAHHAAQWQSFSPGTGTQPLSRS